MTTYNGERFIQKAIDSLCKQTYTDWGMFISDDASTDRTQAICEGYAKKDSRIIYHRQGKNLGMFANFKFVLDKADGEYFMWAAQDDVREKDYLKVCIEKLENNKNLGFATTVLGLIDSSGRTLREEKDLLKLSGKSNILNVSRYVLQPEILGKCNLMYSLFKTDVIKKVWEIYPQKIEWGSDYHFSLAAISHYNLSVDERILFKKRLGGFSDPENSTNDERETTRNLKYKNPKNHMFPFGRFSQYFNGHMEALRGTYYKPIMALLLLIRLPRALFIHIKERNLKNFIKNIFKKRR